MDDTKESVLRALRIINARIGNIAHGAPIEDVVLLTASEVEAADNKTGDLFLNLAGLGAAMAIAAASALGTTPEEVMERARDFIVKYGDVIELPDVT